MTIFISGGCKNGKSTLAEEMARRLAGSGNLYYVATMIPQDGEDMERIRRHVRQRAGKGFQTLEQGRRLEDCLDGACQDGTFLVDSVTALLANEMFPADGPWDLQAGERTAQELCRFAGRVKNAVFVGDFLFSDAGIYDGPTEEYRRALALCHRRLADVCDSVVEVCAACCILHKGVMPE